MNRRSRFSSATSRIAFDLADMRTLREVLAFIACSAMCLLIAWMVLHPHQTFQFLTGLFA